MVDSPKTRTRQEVETDISSGARIAQFLRDEGLDQFWLARASGVPKQTLGGYIHGGVKSASKAVKIARAMGVSVEWLMEGDEAPQSQNSDSVSPILSLPVYDAEVAAGAGRVIDRLGEPLMWWPLSREWVEANLGAIDKVAMVRVRGNSQEPELSDNDFVAVDMSQTKLTDGLYVVRIDDVLLVKHVQREGRRIKLVSRNAFYDPISIDLAQEHEAGGNSFEVIGRAVWASKML